MDNPVYFLLFLLVGCIVVGVPWAIANRIIARVRAGRAARLPQPPPVDHAVRARHMANVLGPLDPGELAVANLLHFATLSEFGVLTWEQMQRNVGSARQLAADFIAEHAEHAEYVEPPTE
jgi:hypothetical protein